MALPKLMREGNETMRRIEEKLDLLLKVNDVKIPSHLRSKPMTNEELAEYKATGTVIIEPRQAANAVDATRTVEKAEEATEALAKRTGIDGAAAAAPDMANLPSETIDQDVKRGGDDPTAADSTTAEVVQRNLDGTVRMAQPQTLRATEAAEPAPTEPKAIDSSMSEAEKQAVHDAGDGTVTIHTEDGGIKKTTAKAAKQAASGAKPAANTQANAADAETVGTGTARGTAPAPTTTSARQAANNAEAAAREAQSTARSTGTNAPRSTPKSN